MVSLSPGAGANPGGYIARAIREGASKTRALAEFRTVGGAMRTQRWYQLWNTVSEAITRASSIAQLPGHRIPGEDVFAPWGTSKPGKFAYQVTVQIRDRDGDFIMNQPSMVFYDRRVSPNKAVADVMGRIEEAYDNEGEYAGYSVEGAQVTGLYQTVALDEGEE